MSEELSTCPQCDGMGYDGVPDEDANVCDWCNGRGRVSQATYEAWAEEMDRNRRRGGPLL